MAAETLVPANAEVGVIAELNARLPSYGFDVPVAATITNATLPEFIRTYRVGGAPADIVADEVTVVVEAYAAQKARAERLCAFAVAVLQAAGRDGLMGSVPCRRVGVFAMPASLPDPNVPDRHRYTATVSVVLRRAAA